MTGFKTTSMRHIGMTRADIKEAILEKLSIGQQYRVNSLHANSDSKTSVGENVFARLVDLRRNVAVFQLKNGTTESFTYQELWMQLLEGILV